MAPHPAARRSDGRVTAEAILQAGGEVFAEKGRLGATSKEICARAGANAAAVNYHFGGFSNLYEAVLLHAHQRMMNWQDLAALAEARLPPVDKLEGLIVLHVEAALGLGSRSWELRLINREMLAPSDVMLRLHRTEVAPRLVVVERIVADVLGAPVDDATLRRAVFCTISPCLMLLNRPPRLLEEMCESEQPGAGDVHRLAKHFARFAFAGLEAVKAGAPSAAVASRPRAAARDRPA
ncbi:CerR family C-terminal domain-containing protein [Roseomonas sp. F4]